MIGLEADDRGRPEISTGIFFAEQSLESLADAIVRFESVETKFSPEFIRRSVQRFDLPRFKSGMSDFIEERLADHCRLQAALANPTVGRTIPAGAVRPTEHALHWWMNQGLPSAPRSKR